ncbi:MAG TPA: hypothetical protein DCO75_10765 [Fibrobacteres bacterium]|jgi:proteasome accessory factor C|nr:hypothetical protein [Fibrobacterota bacterium]
MKQSKTETILRMLVLLSGESRHTIPELARRFSCSERTVYRDLETIENAGFVIDRNQGVCMLDLCRAETERLNCLFHFSDEEAYIFYRALERIKGGTYANDGLVRKLDTLYDFCALSSLSKKAEMETIHILDDAMNSKKQVNLHSYRSSNGETIANRIVEPFDFLPEYSAVWCFDLQDKICKQFKISRIGRVSLLSSDWKNKPLHRAPFTDAFRMSAPAPLGKIEVELTLKATNLLREEYPLAEEYLRDLDVSRKKGATLRYKLIIPVADYHGIGRFVLGLPGEVNVLGPTGFKSFLREAQKKKAF